MTYEYQYYCQENGIKFSGDFEDLFEALNFAIHHKNETKAKITHQEIININNNDIVVIMRDLD